MEKDWQEIGIEDEIFEEIAAEEDDEFNLDATLLDSGMDYEFVQESVDAEDLATGFSATIPTREIDVDEDTQGDEVPDASGGDPLTQFEVSRATKGVVHGDEIELALDEALATGRTVSEAPRGT
ncbi:MAG: hypothetical protein WCA31_00045 [Acidimicrobiales bacterium]